MTSRIPTTPILGFVLVQIALFQWGIWSYLGGNGANVPALALASVACLAGAGIYYFSVSRRPVTKVAPRTPAGAPAPWQPAPSDQWRAVALGTLGFAVSFMAWGLISPLAVEFKAMYGLSNTQVSVLIAVPVLLGSIGRLLVGFVADKVGPRKLYAQLMAFIAIPLALMGFTNSYATLLAVAFMLGVAGTSFTVGVPFVSRWFPPAKQGLAVGIYGMGNFGQALAALYAPRILSALGSWQMAYWLMIPLVLATAAAIWFLGKDAPMPPAPAAGAGNSIWRHPYAWLFSVFYFVTFGGFVAFGNYLPKLYVEFFQLSKATAGSYTALFVLGATLARAVGGWLADKLGATRVLLAVFTLVILAGLGLAASPSWTSFNLTIISLAVALGIGNGAVFKLVPQFFPSQTGAVTGMVGAMGGLGGFFPPLVMGMLRDQVGSYTLGFIFLAAFAVAAQLGVLSLVMNPPASGRPVPQTRQA